MPGFVGNSGNQPITAGFVGTSGGNRPILNGWVGTASGNQQIYSAMSVEVDPPNVFGSAGIGQQAITTAMTANVTGGSGNYAHVWTLSGVIGDSILPSLTAASSASTAVFADDTTGQPFASVQGLMTVTVTDTNTGATAQASGGFQLSWL